MMINLGNVNLINLQTKHMQQDPTTRALCEALNPHFQQLADEVKACLIYPRVNLLDHAALDELAWQMNITWYDTNADLDIKRQLAKSAIKVHKHRGTPYAVEEVIQTYFGDGYVLEWFEYGGAPYMFKVVTNNPTITGEQANLFIQVLEKVKRKSAHLEAIIIALSGEMNMYYAGVVHTGDRLEIRQVV